MAAAQHRQTATPAERARPTLVDRVHEQVLRLIVRGEFPRERKLPTEAELCTRFGVSRTVVRAALIRLREEGHLRSQQGSGWVVVRGPEPGSLHYPPIRSVADLERSYEFRIAVEGQAACALGEPVGLQFNPSCLHLFDAQGRRIDMETV